MYVNGLKVYTREEDERRQDEYDKVRIKCKCGTKNVIPVWVDKQICRGCRNYVYRDKQLEFKEKMFKELKNVKEN